MKFWDYVGTFVERTFRSFHCCFPPVCIVFCPVRYLPVSHWSRTQHLCMRAGKHEGLIFRYSWTQIHIILRQCRKSIAVSVSSLVIYIMLHSEDICHQILKSSKTWRIGTNSGPIFRRLWTEVHEILGQYIEPFVVSKVVFWSAMVRTYVPSSCHVVKKGGETQVPFWPFGDQSSSNVGVEVVDLF